MKEYIGEEVEIGEDKFREIWISSDNGNFPKIIAGMQEIVFPKGTTKEQIVSSGFFPHPFKKYHALSGIKEQYEIAKAVLVHAEASKIAKQIYPELPELRISYIQRFIKDWYEREKKELSDSLRRKELQGENSCR